MSLDVWLSVDGQDVFSANITHNLAEMAREAGMYEALWRPDEIACVRAKEIEAFVAAGLADMVRRPTHYEQFDAQNGWGLYRDFLPWVAKYLEAIRKYPEAVIWISR